MLLTTQSNDISITILLLDIYVSNNFISMDIFKNTFHYQHFKIKKLVCLKFKTVLFAETLNVGNLYYFLKILFFNFFLIKR